MVVRLGEYVLKPAVVSYYESATKRRKVQLIYYGWLDIPSEIREDTGIPYVTRIVSKRK